MITILIFAIIFHVILSLWIDGFIDKPRLPDILFSIFLGFVITILLSVILHVCNVGKPETISIRNYEDLTLSGDKCYITSYEINDDSSYSINKKEISLSNCTFIEDGTQIIEHQNWNFGKGLNWTFLLPIYDSYIIHK